MMQASVVRPRRVGGEEDADSRISWASNRLGVPDQEFDNEALGEKLRTEYGNLLAIIIGQGRQEDPSRMIDTIETQWRLPEMATRPKKRCHSFVK